MIAWDLPASPRAVEVVDLPPPDDDPLPPDVRRDGLWVIEDEDIVWDAPLAGLVQ